MIKSPAERTDRLMHQYSINTRLIELPIHAINEAMDTNSKYIRISLCVDFHFKCPRKWRDLKDTEDENVRFCDECSRNVHYCRNQSEVDERSKTGDCIAVDLEPPTLKVAELDLGWRSMGMPSPPRDSR